MEKAALERLVSTYHWWIAAFAMMAIVANLLKVAVDFRLGRKMRPSRMRLWMSFFLAAVVQVAAVGSLLFNQKVSQASESLQRLADAEVAKANAVAAEANLEATRAKVEIADANAKAAEAQRDSAISLLRAKRAEEDASKNRLETARLEKAAEDERMARLRLELTTTPRRLGPTDQSKMAEELTAFAGVRAPIYYRDRDTEPYLFADDIKQMLIRASWLPSTPEPEATIISDGAPPPPFMLRTGVWVTYSTVRGTFLAARALSRALILRGFEVHIEMASPLSEFHNAPFVFISVEPRPVGAQGRIGASPAL